MIKIIALLALFIYLITPGYCLAFVKASGTPIKETAAVYYVTDGDTVKVKINKQNYIVRLIGADTPETKDPRKAVQCFGKEASAYTKNILLNQTVTLESDPASGNKDIYGRLLRYVFLDDGTNFNRQLIGSGFAYEYTFKSQLYRYRDDFKLAQKNARENKLGLWADSACKGVATPILPLLKATTSKEAVLPVASTINANCLIKGNISSKEKIYHLPGCASYKQTIIDIKSGESWFCNEVDAVKAGFRKAKNCQ